MFFFSLECAYKLPYQGLLCFAQVVPTFAYVEEGKKVCNAIIKGTFNYKDETTE